MLFLRLTFRPPTGRSDFAPQLGDGDEIESRVGWGAIEAEHPKEQLSLVRQ